MCHTKDFRDWPAYYLREQERKPTSLVLRRVNALVGAVFDRDGHLFFASGGDLWEGDITTPSEPGEELPAVEASRFAPVALLETANTTPNSTGARELAVAGRTVYARMGRMGGSGWGEIISVHWPGESKFDDVNGKPSLDGGVEAYIELFKSALTALTSMGRIRAPAIFAVHPMERRFSSLLAILIATHSGFISETKPEKSIR